MNVFVLCTGRCGSMTFIKACSHIENYTAAHESRSGFLGEDHFRYPGNHIEADNRLSWFLGRMEKAYGDDAFYVHLVRNHLDTARSFAYRYNHGIIRAYRTAIVYGCSPEAAAFDVCADYCETVNANITMFLKDKSHKMSLSLENAKEDFRVFWRLIAAEGNLSAALKEWDIAYNATATQSTRSKGSFLFTRVCRKAGRIISQLPAFIKYT